MKKLYFTILFILFCFNIDAKEVSLEIAKKVAYNFIKSRGQFDQIKEKSFRLITIETSSPVRSGISNFIYTFNIEGGGFILIAADDRVEPILGYSLENNIHRSRLPNNISNWFSWYQDQIQNMIENNIPASYNTSLLWKHYQSTNQNLSPRGGQGVNPLLKTKWDQGAPYNAQCPGGSVVGCVATAMAQILKYNAFPTKGQGSKSYNHPNYGTVSANFGTASYDYAAMPNVISSSNPEAAKLNFHCGVSVEMNYTPEESGADGAVKVAPALKNYFSYPNATIEDRNTKTTEQWKTILKQELDASRPIYYEGLGGGSGHAFVCDGYDDNDFFHFNWGWNGTADGFYNINNLTPTATGTGAGMGSYNSDQKIVRNIAAPVVNNPANLVMNDMINLTATSINYGGTLTAEANIVNNGTGKFQGDLGFIILDDSFNYIDTFGVYANVTLNAGNTFQNPVPFDLTSRYSLLPGNYLMALCFKETGKDWSVVTKTNSYGNAANFSVVNANGIEMGSSYLSNVNKMEIASSPSISLQYKNDFTSSLEGTYSLGLYTLDGDYVQTLDTVLDPNPLPVGATHSSPLVFNSSPITAKPGTYLLASIFQQKGSSSSTLVGSSYHRNPIKVIITDKPISPDAYEINNTVAQSSSLAFNQTMNTDNANLHNSDDLDYYKVTIPSDGSMYNFTARLHDKDNSANGKTYTLDAAFTYSTDGTTWANAVNSSMNSAMNVNSGQTIYFLVGPKFSGTVGTYQLDINITKGSASLQSNMGRKINVYPNPCSNYLVLETSVPLMEETQVHVYDLFGRNLLTWNLSKGKTISKYDVSTLRAGQYILRLNSVSYQETISFIKQAE